MNYVSVTPSLANLAAAPGCAVFSLYAANLKTCLREKVFAVPGTLKALAQVLQARSGKQLLLYSIDRHELYHAGWTAVSEPYFDDAVLGFEEGLFPYRVAVEGAENEVYALSIGEVEREIHAGEYAIGLDRSAFKAASVYWISDEQLMRLLSLPGWRKNTSLGSAWQCQPSAIAKMCRIAMPWSQGNWEHRLTVLLLSHMAWLSMVLGEPLALLDSYHALSAANFLRTACMPGASTPSIFDAQGEVDLLLASRDGKTLYVFELKCGLVDNAAVRQLAGYLGPLPYLSAFSSFERIVPVWVGGSFSRRLNTRCVPVHPKIQPPLWVTLNTEKLRMENWWLLRPEEVQWRVYR